VSSLESLPSPVAKGRTFIRRQYEPFLILEGFNFSKHSLAFDTRISPTFTTYTATIIVFLSL
jgi:hypothetical protein